ncbi:MAG TPA: cation diffusion facilitator family transporter [Acidimicrobiales bacterium]|nr:cation diffusion facilitator family transporter [Acidimicrobiales bacterium]
MAENDRHLDHSHTLSADTDVRYVMISLVLISAFLVIEVVTAILSSSLALLADAGHMLIDVAALATSAWALRLAKRPAEGRWTYGLHRAEILSAAVNGVTLAAVALLIGVEAVQRLFSPHHVTGGLVVAVAVLGIFINGVAAWILSKANQRSLNIRGAFLHVLTDLYAFVATAIAGLIIVFTQWERADALASLFVVVLMIRTAWGLLRNAGRILLQGTPDNLDLDDVRAHLIEVEHVLDVHDLHAWTVTSELPTLSAHVVVEERCFDSGHAPRVLDALQKCLSDHFRVEHATFQLEPPTHLSHEEGLNF